MIVIIIVAAIVVVLAFVLAIFRKQVFPFLREKKPEQVGDGDIEDSEPQRQSQGDKWQKVNRPTKQVTETNARYDQLAITQMERAHQRRWR